MSRLRVGTLPGEVMESNAHYTSSVLIQEVSDLRNANAALRSGMLDVLDELVRHYGLNYLMDKTTGGGLEHYVFRRAIRSLREAGVLNEKGDLNV